MDGEQEAIESAAAEWSRAEAVQLQARVVAQHYRTLIEAGVPEMMALWLTQQFYAAQLAARPPEARL